MTPKQLFCLAVSLQLPISRAQALPILLIAIDIAAGLVCLSGGDVRKFVYWTAAAVLTASVTF